MKSIVPLFLAFTSLCLQTGLAASDLSQKKVLAPDPKISRAASVLDQTVIVRFRPGIEPARMQKLLPQAKLAEAMLSAERAIGSKSQPSLLSSEKLMTIRKAEEPLLRTLIIHYSTKESPESFCTRLLKENPNIEIAEPYYVPQLLGTSTTPNDTYVSQQKFLEVIKAFQAWDYFKGSENVVIGISDGGIMQNHEDLKDNIWTNTKEIPDNNKDDDGNGYIDDYRGCNLAHGEDGRSGGDTYNTGAAGSHGTSVAGLAGASFGNGKGVAGVGAKCRIFPIRIAPYGTKSLVYSYQSLAYAAQMQFKVLNCSWGAPAPYSPIYQSLIDYAVSRDVAIVFAGGNEDNSSRMVYPAGYRAVLGVGESDNDDRLSQASSIGAQLGVMSPGGRSLSTSNEGEQSYESTSDGTSFAAPVTSGFVALVRAQYPELSPVQALEFVRQSTDDISSVNPGYNRFIPGRINMLKAAESNPFDKPSIRPLDLETYTSSNLRSSRFRTGDTAIVRIPAFNYLGRGSDLHFSLSLLEDFGSVSLVQPSASLPVLDSVSKFTIGEFAVRINNENTTRVLLRVDITGTGRNGQNYKDYFLLSFIPTTGMTTLSNGTLAYSVGDGGTIGRDNFTGGIRQGTGFGYLLQDSFLYKGGLLLAESESKAPSALDENGLSYSDFAVVKPFIAPAENTGIVNDDNAAAEKIGLEVTQDFRFSPATPSVSAVRLRVKNTSGRLLKDISAGYYFDWDVGITATDDVVYVFPEAIPAPKQGVFSTACYIESNSSPTPVFGCAVSSSQPGAIAQMTGFSNEDIFDDEDRYSSKDRFDFLNNGSRVLATEPSDIGLVIGMKFSGDWQPGESREFIIYFGAAPEKTTMGEVLRKAMLDSIYSDVPAVEEIAGVSVFPQPAADFVNISIPYTGAGELRISNALGEEVSFRRIESETSNLSLRVDTRTMAPGVYFARFTSGTKLATIPFSVVK